MRAILWKLRSTQLYVSVHAIRSVNLNWMSCAAYVRLCVCVRLWRRRMFKKTTYTEKSWMHSKRYKIIWKSVNKMLFTANPFSILEFEWLCFARATYLFTRIAVSAFWLSQNSKIRNSRFSNKRKIKERPRVNLTCKMCSRCSSRRIKSAKLMSAHPNSVTYMQ